ncbi:hypothetical protein R1flu_000313 [Riccia fluitans]|uniref:Uncharacterized protein n=1 Tax=Riccia fluitans TaxID=41844 RepID=A0ABD1Y037_9MARC
MEEVRPKRSIQENKETSSNQGGMSPRQDRNWDQDGLKDGRSSLNWDVKAPKQQRMDREEMEPQITTLMEAEVQRKEQVANAYESLGTMAQECFGDQMEEAELEEQRHLKKFIGPNSKIKVEPSDLMDF